MGSHLLPQWMRTLSSAEASPREADPADMGTELALDACTLPMEWLQAEPELQAPAGDAAD